MAVRTEQRGPFAVASRYVDRGVRGELGQLGLAAGPGLALGVQVPDRGQIGGLSEPPVHDQNIVPGRPQCLDDRPPDEPRPAQDDHPHSCSPIGCPMTVDKFEPT